jgi:hypothetical protein
VLLLFLLLLEVVLVLLQLVEGWCSSRWCTCSLAVCC